MENVEQSPRRQAKPASVFQLWDGIDECRRQRQSATQERILKNIKDVNKSEMVMLFEAVVTDGLIKKETYTGCKGSKKGQDMDRYLPPDYVQIEREAHDWYCMHCHLGGNMLLCDSCQRVYHHDCLVGSLGLGVSDFIINDRFLCPTCKGVDAASIEEDLNILLSYTIVRVRNMSDILYNLSDESEVDWRESIMIHTPMDLNTMSHKVQERKYTSTYKFLGDCELILHNMILVDPGQPKKMLDESVGKGRGRKKIVASRVNMAKWVLDDCRAELNEMRLCKTCYHFSNRRKLPQETMWFADPCYPTPHQIVWAKQKTYPFWPAKVMKRLENGEYDVRYFGGNHDRGHILDLNIKPFGEMTSLNDLGILPKMKTKAWQSSYEEAKEHERLVSEGVHEQSKLINGDGTELGSDFFLENGINSSVVKKKAKVNRKRKMSPEKREEMPEKKKKRHHKKHKKVNKQEEFSKLDEYDFDDDDNDDDLDQYKPRKARKFKQKDQKVFKMDLDLEKNKEFDDLESSSQGVNSNSRHQEENLSLPPSLKSEKQATKVKVQAKKRVEKCLDKCSNCEKIKRENDLIIKELQVRHEMEVNSLNGMLNRQDKLASLEDDSKSTEEFLKDELNAAHKKIQELEMKPEQDSEAVVRRGSESADNRKSEIERLRKEMSEMKRTHEKQLREMENEHEQKLLATKKKQWCIYCGLEAMYHCCWNTSYCSTDCQREHWRIEHKVICRRSRDGTQSTP